MLVLNEQLDKKKETKKLQTKHVAKLTQEDKALQLFQAGAVIKARDDLYRVKCQKDPMVEYEVIPSMNVCTCVDFERNGRHCKHIIATQIWRTSQIAATLTAAKIQELNKIGKVVMTC
jgi:SWIM zinc finger